MTREKAIDILDDNFTVIDTHGHFSDEEVEEARQMAIKALEDKPCDGVILIPKNATNGDMIMAMFPNAKANVFAKEVGVKGLDTYSTFTKKWWNAPYEGGKE